MPELLELEEFLDPPVLKMPYRGRTYEVQECSAAVWLKLTALFEATRNGSVAEAISDIDLFRMTLGDELYAELFEQTPKSFVELAGITAWYWQLGLPDTAKAYFANKGKALTPEPSPTTPESKVSTRQTTQRKTRTAAASTTRSRASGTSTSGRRTSKRS
ncbi:hypothetical protein SAMN05444157_1626 [Frankineae bacterium MT45]|nr:hypothetical protein SAMN05444157_1626 [Frankineae bacterium MT45]